MTQAYGDKLLLSIIIFDLPNFALSLTYILVIEANEGEYYELFIARDYYWHTTYLARLLMAFITLTDLMLFDYFVIDDLYVDKITKMYRTLMLFMVYNSDAFFEWVLFGGRLYLQRLHVTFMYHMNGMR